MGSGQGQRLYGKGKLLELKERSENMSNKIETLDLRPMPPFERHEKIFQMWDILKPGEVLRIINDHDPSTVLSI